MAESGKGKRVTVYVADDHPIYREGLVGALKLHPDLEIVGEASDGATALEQIRELEPDVAVLDLAMPGLTGFQVLKEIQSEGLATRVVVLSASSDSETVFRAVAEGAIAYVPKESSRDEVSEAILAASRGEVLLSKGVQGGLMGEIRSRGGREDGNVGRCRGQCRRLRGLQPEPARKRSPEPDRGGPLRAGDRVPAADQLGRRQDPHGVGLREARRHRPAPRSPRRCVRDCSGDRQRPRPGGVGAARADLHRHRPGDGRVPVRRLRRGRRRQLRRRGDRRDRRCDLLHGRDSRDRGLRALGHVRPALGRDPGPDPDQHRDRRRRRARLAGRGRPLRLDDRDVDDLLAAGSSSHSRAWRCSPTC